MAAVACFGMAVAEEPLRPVQVRVQWGGGTPRGWTGRIAVTHAAGHAAPHPLAWQTLCREPDAATLAHGTPDGIAIHQPRPIATDGVELTIHDWPTARIRVELAPTVAGAPGGTIDVAVVDVLDAAVQQPLDGEGNRLSITPAPSEPLRVTLAGPPNQATTVHRPGDILRFRVDPLIPLKPGVGDIELRLRLSAARQDAAIDSQATKLVPLSSPVGSTPVGGRLPTPFAGVDFEVSLPAEEGVFEVSLEAVELRGLRWTKPLASRVIQVVAIASEPPPPDPTEWNVVYELDPGSPRLHERLRRLPGRGLSAIPIPAVPLPAMPLPSLTRPNLPLPRLPEVPVALPDVSAMVPRLSGLLASGHSVVEPHPLGPMLRLPPAPDSERPTWEAVTIAAAREGMPHLIEIDYPTDQRATVAVCVLEADAGGGRVEVRHAGGFSVDPRRRSDPAPLATHRFIFWPTSRSPVVVIANPDPDSQALVGKMRVSTGPVRLPSAAGNDASRASGRSDGTRRPTYAVLPDPDLPLFAGGAARSAGSGRSLADWLTHFAAIRHLTERASFQGLTGTVVTAYADGAALWPTALTRHAPRWQAAGDGQFDPVPKDLLGAVVRVSDREGVALIPSLRFNAAVPAIEAELLGAAPAGLICVGGDGRPRSLPGGPHYNILDPRVQRAVEEIVDELAGRLRTSRCVTGIAIELPHDGWLHLPGVAWGLDDATFARFLAAIDEPAAVDLADSGRFAERARLVKGPLRREWLAWRTSQLAAFHARLTAIVAGQDGRWPLYVVPTTLFTAGDLAARFSPHAAPVPGTADDLIREAGLITNLPEGIAHGGRLVFMSPWVTADAAPLTERSLAATASASLPLAAASATAETRGVSILPLPLTVDLGEVVPHGPFGGATAAGPARARILALQPPGDADLAGGLVAADASVVFDMRPSLVTSAEPSPARRSLDILPAGPLQLVDPLPAPLVVRSLTADGRTWLQVINAAPAPLTASIRVGKDAAGTGTLAALDAVDGTALSIEHGILRLPLAAWDVRAIAIDGTGPVGGVTLDYAPDLVAGTAARIETLRQRLGVLHAPQPLDVLDNPGFELAVATGQRGEPAVTGWELLETRRGSLAVVAGIPTAADPDSPGKPGRGLEFTSFNGLSTLRSNPFPPPKTGRISVAAWLRIKPGDQQPPLRIAVEGVEDGREYYRFAAVGGLAGGRPLAGDWSLFVLQVDDLPPDSVESLRVRFDLLGPGGVQIDDVSVYDLAFDETERAGLAKELARIDHQFKQGDVGAAIVGLTGHWPEFLEAFVSDEAVAAWAKLRAPPAAATPAPQQPEQRQGALDRLRSWWQ